MSNSSSTVAFRCSFFHIHLEMKVTLFFWFLLCMLVASCKNSPDTGTSDQSDLNPIILVEYKYTWQPKQTHSASAPSPYSNWSVHVAHFAKQASNEAIECLKTKLASFLGFNFEFENGAAYHSVLFHYLKELQIKKINMQQAQSQLFLERLRYISNFKSPQPLKLLNYDSNPESSKIKYPISVEIGNFSKDGHITRQLFIFTWIDHLTEHTPNDLAAIQSASLYRACGGNHDILKLLVHKNTNYFQTPKNEILIISDFTVNTFIVYRLKNIYLGKGQSEMVVFKAPNYWDTNTVKLKYFDFFQKPDLTSINKKLTKYLGSTTLVTSKQTEALVTMSTDPFVYLSKVLSFDNETVTKFQIVMDVNADHSTTVDCDFHALYEMYPKTTKPKASPSDGLNKWNPAKNKEQATAQLEIDKSKSYVYIWIEGNRKFEPNDASLGELVRAGLLDVFGDEIGEQPSEIAYYYEENKLNAIRVIFPSYSQKVFQFCNVTNEAVSVNN